VRARSFATHRRLLVAPLSARKSSLREGATGTALASEPLRRKTRLEERGEPDEGAALGANRAQFFLDVPSGPFYGFNRPGAKISQGLIENWWRQGMMGGAKAHYDCIKAFSETDFTEDLKAIDGLLAIKLVKHGTLKTYPGLPHGIASTHPDVINADLLEFARS
jgi:non-heme chloroperoxidase